MKIRRIFPVLLLVGMFLASSAMAGNYPEYDAVGVDKLNYFATKNADFGLVNTYSAANKIDNTWDLELYSNFPSTMKGYADNPEGFTGDGGQLFTDPCWGQFKSILTTVQRSSTYEWVIVLQMQPESDIDLNIHDCVMKWEGAKKGGLFGWAEQTGRWRADWGKLYFSPCANPELTVTAYPGPFAVAGWDGWQKLEARKMPGLHKTTLCEKPYTSKAHWDEGIVIALPETGCHNDNGDANYQLVQGDIIKVRIDIPPYNTADIYYGQDSVILKYIGMSGTYMIGENK